MAKRSAYDYGAASKLYNDGKSLAQIVNLMPGRTEASLSQRFRKMGIQMRKRGWHGKK